MSKVSQFLFKETILPIGIFWPIEFFVKKFSLIKEGGTGEEANLALKEPRHPICNANYVLVAVKVFLIGFQKLMYLRSVLKAFSQI